MREVTDFPHDPIRQERDRRFFQMLGEPLLMGLQRKDGQFVSILAAVRFEKCLHVLSQLNDQSLRRMSISVVLRWYLIEKAIELGFTSIHFVNGSSPMLGRYCQAVSVQTILIDHRGSLLHPSRPGRRGSFEPTRSEGNCFWYEFEISWAVISQNADGHRPLARGFHWNEW
jgi:hypothetical protein